MTDGDKEVKSRSAAAAQRVECGSMTENALGTLVLDAAFTVHRELGPALLESVYEAALFYEIIERKLDVKRQVSIPIVYKGVPLPEGFRADLIVENKVLIELKSVFEIGPIHKKQTQTYLRLTGLKLGYLLNFGAAVMRAGITRCVNAL